MPYEEYKELVGTAAGVVTIGQFFSPIFICKKIVAQGNTENVDPMPFVGGFGMSMLMLQHGFILQDNPMIAVNCFAFALNLIYIGLYWAYTNERGKLLGSLARTIVSAAAIIGYAQIDMRISPGRAEVLYGIIITVLLFALIGAPLREVKTIIAEKNAEKLPFPLILSGTCVTFLWLLYGIIIDNVFMKFQNVVGFTLSVIQLTLCLKYSSPTKSTADKAKKVE